MVMINTTISELGRILKRKISRKELEELCFRYGIDIEGEGDFVNFEVTSDRIEIISKFSLADLLGRLMGIRVHRYDSLPSKKMDIVIKAAHRPFVNILYVKLDEPAGKELQDLLVIQDKFDRTVGRSRSSAAIGMFDFSNIKFPIEYREVDKDSISFVPLGFDSEKSYKEILDSTEKGKEYGSLLKEKPIVWKQKDGKIFALPPIINADFSSLTKDTRQIFVDITGNDRYAVNALTKALAFNLQFVGEVSVVRPVYKNKNIDTGLSFKQENFLINVSNVSTLLGIELSLKEIAKTLNAMDYTVKENESGLEVSPPFYRQDVIHQVDIVDDILRFYGAQRIIPSAPSSYTPGAKLQNSGMLENISSLLVGFGYQELDLNVLTSENYQFNKTGIKNDIYASLIGQKSGEITMARSNLTGEMLRFISNNLHKKFPQKLFDVGFVLERADVDVVFKNALRLSICSCGQETNLSEIVVILERLLRDSFGEKPLNIRLDETMDGFSKLFIKGRSGLLYYGGKKIGVIGEVHPRVLNEFGIELPVSLTEVYLTEFSL